MARAVRGRTSGQTILTARRLRRQLTDVEQVLWSSLRDSRMQGIKFRRQHPFGPYVLDFFCVQAQLAVELDGGIHDRPEQIEYDRERTAFLEAEGLRVLRFRNEDIADKLDQVMNKILEATSPTPQPPPSPAMRERGDKTHRLGEPKAGVGEGFPVR
jgi:very-short-patch-repair endonuclease